MKKINFKLLSIILIFSLQTLAQTPSFQWVVNGGATGNSTDNKDLYGKDVYTDDYGNIYGTSQLYGGYNKIDTIEYGGNFGYDDFCVYSYNCDGSFRWVRYFGGWANDFCAGIAVDGQGNVFVAGHIQMSNTWNSHFGDSTILASNNYDKKDFVAKLDSSGHTEWISFPGNASTVNLPPLFVDHIELNNTGNPQVIYTFFGSCIYGGFTIPDSGLYLFDFNKTDGNLINIKNLQFKHKNLGSESYFMNIDTDNNLYLNCFVADTIYIGNDTITDFQNGNYRNTILVKYSNSGVLQWYKEIKGEIGSSSNYFNAITGKPIIIDNSIYVIGLTQSYPGTNFQGIPINNPMAKSNNVLTFLIAKFNKNDGTLISAINIKNRKSIYTNLSLGVRDNQIIVASTGGSIIGINQNDTIKPYTTSYDAYPFVVSVDTALSHFNWGFATIASGSPNIHCMNVDRKGNIYVSGMMQNAMENSIGQVYQPTTGGDNFFIAKVAIDNNQCGCVFSEAKAEVISFSNQILSVKSSFTEPIDSAYWYWGDGDSSFYSTPGQIISHTYSGSGPYDVCLKTWNYCGVTDTCILGLVNGVEPSFNKNMEIKYYPNPFNNSIIIETNASQKNIEVIIYDLPGKELIRMNLVDNKTLLNTQNLKPGIYLLIIQDEKGNKEVKKLVKR